MAITLLERTQIEKVFVAFLNAAPSITYLNQLVGYAGKVDVLAKDLSQTDAFLSIYPVALTNEEFAAKFVANFVGSTASADAQTYVKDEIVKSLNAGISRGDTLFNVVVALQAVPDGDATFGTTKKAFENKVAVADYYAVTKLATSTDLATLQGVIAGVTATTDVSTDAAKESAIAGTVTGTTFALTTNQDTLTGSAGNDIFTAGVAGDTAGNLADTLQSVDSVNGGAGTDTLNVTINQGAVVTASLTSIENVNLRSTANGSGVSLAASTGVEKATVANSTGTAFVNGVGALASFAVADQKTDVTFNDGTATTVALSAKNVGTVSATAPVEVTVNFDDNAFLTANLTVENSNIALTNTTAGNNDLKTVTIAATGSNTVKLTAGATTAESITVTGAGSVDLRGVSLSAAKTLTVADGGVKATVTNGTAGAFTATTGAGADTLTVDGGGLKSVSTGAGKDAVTVSNAALNTAATTAAATAAASAAASTTAAAKVTNLTTLAAAIGVGTTDANVGLATTAAVASGAILAADKVAIDAAAVSAGAGAVDAAELAAVSAIITPLQTAATAAAATALATATADAAASTAAAAAAAAAGVVAATSSIDLGAGDDTLTLGSAFAAGATLSGGDGVDTLAINKASYGTVTAGGAYTDAVLAKVTGFETLSITDSLVTGTLDISKIAGIVNFKAAAGVTAANAAIVSNLGANSNVELAGADTNNGDLTVTLKTDTAADSLTLVLNHNFTDNNDATSSALNAAAQKVVVGDIESLTVNSTGTNTSLPFTAVTGYKADTITNNLNLTGSNKLTSVTVTGDQKLVLASTAAMTKLATVDASANTGGLDFDGTLADMATPTTSVAMTIKGSLTAGNTLTGSGHADTIVGGAKADTITGGLGGDTLTGNGGNDTFVFGAGSSVIGTGTFDTITDFVANTYGAGTNGAVDTHGAVGVAADKLTGDLIKIAADTAAATDIIKTFVASNASDATTFLANNKAAGTVTVALDSSTGNLYIDNVNHDGVADLYIHLTGVTTIDAAAILLV